MNRRNAVFLWNDKKSIRWFQCPCALFCMYVFSDYIHNASLPVQLQGEAAGSSSSEHGSVSPDCDSKHDVFFQRKKSSGSENLLKPPNSNYLRCYCVTVAMKNETVCEVGQIDVKRCHRMCVLSVRVRMAGGLIVPTVLCCLLRHDIMNYHFTDSSWQLRLCVWVYVCAHTRCCLCTFLGTHSS